MSSEFLLTQKEATRHVLSHLPKNLAGVIVLVLILCFSLVDPFNMNEGNPTLTNSTIALFMIFTMIDAFIKAKKEVQKLTNSYYQIQETKLKHYFEDESRTVIDLHNLDKIRNTSSGICLVGFGKKWHLSNGISNSSVLFNQIEAIVNNAPHNK